MSTEGSIRSHFGLRRIPTVVLVTHVIALLAWVAIVGGTLSMSGTMRGLQMTAPGVPEAIALSNGFSGVLMYLVMWGVMMIAMMYPSSVPLFRLYYSTIGGTTTTGKAARVGAFMGTYALIWAVTGVVPLVVNAAVPVAAATNEHRSVMIGGTLLLLSAYQLSSYKHRCLNYCRTPLGFLMQHYRPGVRGAATMSFRFSAFCIGCCWALFAFLVAVGSMNILWMAGVALVISLERVIDRGALLARAVGLAAGIGGVGIIALAVGGVVA